MGKRKTRKKPPPKIKGEAVPTNFDCPFCGSISTISSQIIKDKGVGKLKCTVCDAKFQMKITSLTAAIDIYNEWVDQTAALNRPDAGPIETEEPEARKVEGSDDGAEDL